MYLFKISILFPYTFQYNKKEDDCPLFYEYKLTIKPYRYPLINNSPKV